MQEHNAIRLKEVKYFEIWDNNFPFVINPTKHTRKREDFEKKMWHQQMVFLSY